jgi:hypothetical protein
VVYVSNDKAAGMTAHPNGKTMKSISFEKYGKPTELKKIETAYPHGFDASNNVVIKVHAASVNPVDKAFLSGDFKMVIPVAAFPHVISYDVAGVVAEADQAGTFSVGQPVFARLFGNAKDGKKTPWYRGAMAEFCVADVSNVVAKPENLTFEEAASIPLVGMTALQILNNSGLKEGDSISFQEGLVVLVQWPFNLQSMSSRQAWLSPRHPRARRKSCARASGLMWFWITRISSSKTCMEAMKPRSLMCVLIRRGKVSG